jgi:hypothetical protein
MDHILKEKIKEARINLSKACSLLKDVFVTEFDINKEDNDPIIVIDHSIINLMRIIKKLKETDFE